jgi:hypothetical protein
MGRRDYELEHATAAVDGRVSESIVRALIVGAPGSAEGTLGGAIKSLFGRKRRTGGLKSRNVLVLTPTSILLFTCDARGWPPEVQDEVGAWPVRDVKATTEAGKKWTGWSATESGSETNYFYDISLTVPGAEEPVVVQYSRTDSARATMQALEDATGSPPSKATARRRKKQQRERVEAERESQAEGS